MKTEQVQARVEKLVAHWGVPQGDVELVSLGGMLLAVTLIAVIARYIAKHFIIRAVTRFVRRTETKWDDKLIDRRVFDRISQLVPGMLLFIAAPLVLANWPLLEDFAERAAIVYMGIVVVLAIDGLFNAVVDVYEDIAAERFTPVKSYVQVGKIVIYVVAAIMLIATAIGRSPVVLLSGLGALSAVLFLVFKDSILGLVASIQLSGQDMVRKGDWIEVPKYGADGAVIDIALTTIKVQNWDKTISTVPSYSLISDSFRNWRGMTEAGGRRIKRALSIDMNTVQFCTPEDLSRYEQIALLREYVQKQRKAVEEDNAARSVDLSNPANGRRLTNLGTFRAYVLAYLRANTKIHQGMTLLVRQLAPGDAGIPIELYCFSNDIEWANYEAIQSDIFDHLLAVLPQFGLRVFQAPTGADFRRSLKPPG